MTVMEVPSEQPAESLAIDGKEADPNEFGFLSLTHTEITRIYQSKVI